MLDDVTPTQRSEMADFFMRELNTPGWPIALSRSDPLGYVDRPDHGTTGSYASWPPLAFEGLARLESSFANATGIIIAAASTARQGPFGQAQAVQVVGPPRGQDATPFKSMRGATR